VTRQREVATERERLRKAIMDAEHATQTTEKRSKAAQSAYADWDNVWSALLVRAGLPADTGAAAAHAALETFNGIATQLKSASDLRVRVAAMQEDLQAYAHAAWRARQALGLADGLSPDAIALAAIARLEVARDALQRYDGARTRCKEAQGAVDAAGKHKAERRLCWPLYWRPPDVRPVKIYARRYRCLTASEHCRQTPTPYATTY